MKTAFLFSLLLSSLLLGVNQSATAQQKGTGSIMEQFRQGMIAVCKEMISIAGSVNTVEDAEKAEPRIAVVIDRLTLTLNEVAANAGNLTAKDLKEMEMLSDDPEMRKWTDALDRAMEKLEARNAEANERLQEIASAHTEQLQEAIAGLMMNMSGEDEAGMEPEEESAE